MSEERLQSSIRHSLISHFLFLTFLLSSFSFCLLAVICLSSYFLELTVLICKCVTVIASLRSTGIVKCDPGNVKVFKYTIHF